MISLTCGWWMPIFSDITCRLENALVFAIECWPYNLLALLSVTIALSRARTCLPNQQKTWLASLVSEVSQFLELLQNSLRLVSILLHVCHVFFCKPPCKNLIFNQGNFCEVIRCFVFMCYWLSIRSRWLNKHKNLDCMFMVGSISAALLCLVCMLRLLSRTAAGDWAYVHG